MSRYFLEFYPGRISLTSVITRLTRQLTVIACRGGGKEIEKGTRSGEKGSEKEKISSSLLPYLQGSQIIVLLLNYFRGNYCLFASELNVSDDRDVRGERGHSEEAPTSLSAATDLLRKDTACRGGRGGGSLESDCIFCRRRRRWTSPWVCLGRRGRGRRVAGSRNNSCVEELCV